MNIIRAVFIIAWWLSSYSSTGQDTKDKLSNRIFMPSIQMGYINNHSDLLSGGLFVQTSIEYQTRSGVFFRLNFDDFDSDYELIDGLNASGVLRGKVSFSELIGGIGYRYSKKKHNILLSMQTGGRYYGHPVIESQGNNISLQFENRDVMINRYTLGYEYEVDKRAFLTLELFGSHVFEKQDYWTEDIWSSGFTIGITTTIF